MRCTIDRIPIHIPAATAIHAIRVHPATLKTNYRMQFQGVFEDIGPSGGEESVWPSNSSGRWMTRAEIKKVAVEDKGLPTPYAETCTLSSYSSATLEAISAGLIVDTSDKKRHSYDVLFDPLLAGHSFQFYLVNGCSFGITPLTVQWDDFAKVRFMGEKDMRTVPLQFGRTNFPSQLSWIFGPSLFIWNGMNTCDWDR